MCRGSYKQTKYISKESAETAHRVASKYPDFDTKIRPQLKRKYNYFFYPIKEDIFWENLRA